MAQSDQTLDSHPFAKHTAFLVVVLIWSFCSFANANSQQNENTYAQLGDQTSLMVGKNTCLERGLAQGPEVFKKCIDDRVNELALQVLLQFEPQTIAEISNDTAQPFDYVNPLHDHGLTHSQMYRAKYEGRPMIIKVMNYFYDTPELLLEPYLIAESLGGPAIRKVGILKDEMNLSDRPRQFFIMMDEIFSDDPFTFTLKGVYFNLGPIQPPVLSPAQIQKVAHLVVSALSMKVVTDDSDMIFSSQHDDVYWIDAGDWGWAKKDSLMISETAALIHVFDRFGLTQEYLEAVTFTLNQDKWIDPFTKTKLLQVWQKAAEDLAHSKRQCANVIRKV